MSEVPDFYDVPGPLESGNSGYGPVDVPPVDFDGALPHGSDSTYNDALPDIIAPPEANETGYDGDAASPPSPLTSGEAGGEESGDIAEAPKDALPGLDNEPLFSFQRKFDGTQTPPPLAEQKAAGGVFGDFAVRAAKPWWSFANTEEITEEGRRILVDINGSQKTVPTPADPTDITFTEMDADGERGESSKYSLHTTGIVTRRDTTRTQREANAMEMRTLPPISDLKDASPERRAEIAAAHLGWIEKRISDLTMDMDFGFNEQAVGMEEVQAVIELARRALTVR